MTKSVHNGLTRVHIYSMMMNKYVGCIPSTKAEIGPHDKVLQSTTNPDKIERGDFSGQQIATNDTNSEIERVEVSRLQKASKEVGNGSDDYRFDALANFLVDGGPWIGVGCYKTLKNHKSIK